MNKKLFLSHFNESSCCTFNIQSGLLKLYLQSLSWKTFSILIHCSSYPKAWERNSHVTASEFHFHIITCLGMELPQTNRRTAHHSQSCVLGTFVHIRNISAVTDSTLINLGPSSTDASFHSDICPGNIRPGDICPCFCVMNTEAVGRSVTMGLHQELIN